MKSYNTTIDIKTRDTYRIWVSQNSTFQIGLKADGATAMKLYKPNGVEIEAEADTLGGYTQYKVLATDTSLGQNVFKATITTANGSFDTSIIVTATDSTVAELPGGSGGGVTIWEVDETDQTISPKSSYSNYKVQCTKLEVSGQIAATSNIGTQGDVVASGTVQGANVKATGDLSCTTLYVNGTKQTSEAKTTGYAWLNSYIDSTRLDTGYYCLDVYAKPGVNHFTISADTEECELDDDGKIRMVSSTAGATLFIRLHDDNNSEQTASKQGQRYQIYLHGMWQYIEPADGTVFKETYLIQADRSQIYNKYFAVLRYSGEVGTSSPTTKNGLFGVTSIIYYGETQAGALQGGVHIISGREQGDGYVIRAIVSEDYESGYSDQPTAVIECAYGTSDDGF